MTETEQRYHSNKQEFLALKWAVTEQLHEYLSPYGKNRNEFVVQTDNNWLTYIFSSANLDAARQRWVAQLASYNFALEYQKGKDNTVATFLSHFDNHLSPGEVQDYLNTEGNRQKSCLGLCEIQGPTGYEKRPPVSAVQTGTDPGDRASVCCSSDS